MYECLSGWVAVPCIFLDLYKNMHSVTCNFVHCCKLKFFSLTVMPAVIVRQRKPYRRKDGTTLYFEGESHKIA